MPTSSPLRGSPPRWMLMGLLSGLALVAWDASGWDMPLAHLAGTAQGFALRDHWFLTQVLHSGARAAGYGVLALLVLAACLPQGRVAGVPRGTWGQAATAVVLSLLSVSVLKSFSATSCPWDLQAFGGTAQWISHWHWGVLDGGGGRCFPAGHAAAGFSFIGVALALRPHRPRLAAVWLAGALATGLVLGLSQQLRGAHFMSHTLWTAWCCWMVGAATDAGFAKIRAHRRNATRVRERGTTQEA